MKKLLLIVILFFIIVMINAKTVGLVLSGGGSRALAQIGVLKVLDSLNVKIDYIVGTSMGAFIGGLYAMGYSANQIENLLKNTDWKKVFNDNIERKDYNIAEKRWMPFSKYYFYINNFYNPQFPKAFLFGENFILKVFELTYPSYKLKNFDQLPIKYRCVATNLLNGKEKIFSKGALHEVIRASMAFPAVLQPFKIGDDLYIDGGITDNFPVDVMIKKFHPDFIIGIRTNTDLKKINEMATALDILKQTVNINIIKKVKYESSKCNLLIQPHLETSFMNFTYQQKVLNKGKKEAEKYINILSTLPKWEDKPEPLKLNHKIKINDIKIIGNRYLSKSKVLEYLNLKKGKEYSIKNLIKSFNEAYNTDLFNYIYPVLKNENNKTVLYVIEEEKLRKKVGFNFSIINDNDFSANVYGIFTNILQKNSKLILNLKAGTEKEIVEDYVKNFGKTWGAYFRIFSDWMNKKFIIYDDSTYYKLKSIKNDSKEINVGSGIFIKSIIAAELYSYLYNADYSRDIGEFLRANYKSYGIGFKIYHESLDNFVFPMKGIRILSKYRIFKIKNFSKTQFNLIFKGKFILRLKNNASLIYSNEFATMRYNSPSKDYSPFTIGGQESFLGLNRNEITSIRYLINRIAIRKKIKNLYIDFQFNGLINKKKIKFDILGFGIKLGINTFLGPIKIAAATNDHGQKFLYFSLGYNFDPFEFSRR